MSGALSAASTAVRLASEARDAASVALVRHRQDSHQKAANLAALDAEMQSHRIAVALGDAAEGEGPDTTTFVTLKSDIEVAQHVESKLQARLDAAEAALKSAERSRRAAISDYLKRTAVGPAREELAQAFGVLRDAATRLMAAHYLAHRKFDGSAPTPNNALELYGPIAELLGAMPDLTWANYPYTIRPAWIPANGRFWPDELPGVSAANDALLAEIEREEAA